MLVSPATPTTAFRLGEKVDDPLAMYLFDLCTLPLNLAGHCGMSVPSGLSEDDGLPVGCRSWHPRWPMTGSTGWAPPTRRRAVRCRPRSDGWRMVTCGLEFSPVAATVPA